MNRREGEKFEKRQQQRKDLREKMLQDKERLQHFTKENQQKFLDEIINQELGTGSDKDTSVNKKLSELVEDCIKENPEYMFLNNHTPLWNTEDPE